MPPTNAEIVTYLEPDEADVERIARRQVPLLGLGLAEPRPEWAARFAEVAAAIRTALAGLPAITVEHVGSTAVPGLPAKDVLDVDLVVPDPRAEAAYVPALEALGFRFLLREPRWYEHRFFVREAPAPGHAARQAVNLHVFGPDAAEPVRHRLFRDRLRAHAADRDRYAAAKRDALRATLSAGEDVPAYTARKDAVVRDILENAFKEHGLLPP